MDEKFTFTDRMLLGLKVKLAKRLPVNLTAGSLILIHNPKQFHGWDMSHQSHAGGYKPFGRLEPSISSLNLIYIGRQIESLVRVG